ncbi:uncharacterized protein [Haliotis cracherodii]|uniref:uncharacterized protein n=1 Tax=Haliotis cracherodii TaxID=6455 RepID=UPI0039E82F29
MLSRNVVKVAMVTFVLCVCGILVMEPSTPGLWGHESPRLQADVDRAVLKAEGFRQQRNQLSSILNGVKLELALISCQMVELNQPHNKASPGVSATGGWCKHNSKSSTGEHKFDETLAEELSLLFYNQSVASFGDGPGTYKKYIDSTHRVHTYDAFDGAPYGREVSGGVVRFLDLTAPQYGLPLYDWVMSLEVAEHIPSKYETIYIDNVVRHAEVGIVLSWAVPGQGGLAHVNNRPLAYVQRVLLENGFEPDMEASTVLQKRTTLRWLKRNVYVYRRLKGSTVSDTNA